MKNYQIILFGFMAGVLGALFFEIASKSHWIQFDDPAVIEEYEIAEFELIPPALSPKLTKQYCGIYLERHLDKNNDNHIEQKKFYIQKVEGIALSHEDIWCQALVKVSSKSGHPSNPVFTTHISNHWYRLKKSTELVFEGITKEKYDAFVKEHLKPPTL